MLACIACSKHVQGSVEAMDDDEIPKSPATKETIRSITNQLKGMAVRFSAGAYRHCRPCASPDIHEEGSCIDSMDITDASSEVSTSNAHQHGGSANFFSTPPQSFHSTPAGKHNPAQERRNGYGRKGAAQRAVASPRASENLVRADQNGASGYEAAREEEEEEEEMEKDWVAQVEPGVLITLVTLAEGGNDLKRIRFSREIFNKWQAQQWWAENCEKVHELYNVPRFNRLAGSSLPTSSRSEDELKTTPAPCDYVPHGIYHPPLAPATRPPSSYKSHPPPPPVNQRKPQQRASNSNSSMFMAAHISGLGSSGECLAESIHASRTSSSCQVTSSISDLDAAERPDDMQSSGEVVSTSNVSEQEVEWVEEDEPGVYISLRSSPGAATRELKRVRFSREKFTEIQARLWWEENRIRIHEQYL